MADARTLPEFVYLAEFDRQAKRLFTDEDVEVLEARLVENPEVGAVIAAAGGVRKVRVELEGRGRSGGARVIYYYRTAKGRIYMLYAYRKNEAQNLSARGKQLMATLVRAIEAEA